MSQAAAAAPPVADQDPSAKRFRLSSGWVGAAMLAVIVLPCVSSLPWTLGAYDAQNLGDAASGGGAYAGPSWSEPMGTDALGRSLLARCLLGGALSLAIGVAAASIALCIGVTWGALAGYFGGRVDATMMRIVDVVYGLPYILMVVLLDLALSPVFEMIALWLGEKRPILKWEGWNEATSAQIADIITLLVAIGGVSWLTMARVIRGQVLSLRAQPFIEATAAMGMRTYRVFLHHLLPNLVGPIVVYATLAVPQAILQESFLSFLGIGVRPPLPSWGNLAAEGVQELPGIAVPGLELYWWLLVWPCVLLGVTLLGLNFVGDALRDRFDPKGKNR
ncbi:MAG: ABC transporter permease [Planctomycetota bacterium]